MTDTNPNWKYEQLAEMGVSDGEIERIRVEDIRLADLATPVPDGGDAHEHQYAKQVDVGEFGDLPMDGGVDTEPVQAIVTYGAEDVGQLSNI